MAYHVLILTSSYLTQYLEDVLKDNKLNIRYRIVEYQSFNQLKDLYLANEKWADGVLTTGAVVKRVLELAVDIPLKPIIALGTDNESFYRIPLSLLIEDRALDPERIIFDVFIRMLPTASVLNLLESRSMQEIFSEFARWLSEATLEELYQIEDDTLRQIKVLWETKQIDLVICRYGSLINQLKELSIPCVFATCTDAYLYETLQHLLSAIKMEKIKSHAPAAVAILSENTSIFNDRIESRIQQALLQFGEDNDLDYIIQKKKGLLLILTEKAVVSYLTDKFRQCRLTTYLEEALGQPVTVCYGIGNTIDEAIKNAKSALRSSGLSRYPYLIDEDQQLIGPLGDLFANALNDGITPEMREVAKKASLSVSSVQRLIRLTQLLDRKELTSADIAGNFHISARGANRILEKLEMAGLATPSLDKNPHLKGRPCKIYHLNWNF